MRIARTFAATAIALSVALARGNAFAALDATDTTWDGSEPPEGVYFYWYEPSFYTGFAPRTQDPQRVHIRLSRGNQVRVTVVLGEQELDAYLDDLLARQKTYQELIDAKVIALTTNREYERFVAKLEEAGVAAAAKSRGTSSPDAYRQKSVEMMSALNPERVFHIKMPVDKVVASWHEQLTGMSAESMNSTATQLDATNAILPGRVNAYQLGPELTSSLSRAVEVAHTEKPDTPAFREVALAFLDRATGGRYRVRDGFVEAVEFTTIYPAGTIDATTTYKGERLPGFGVSGVWPLIPRTQGRGITGMVDYLSPNPGYGFITMLPYEHAGGIVYNAFHNAGVRCGLGETPFLPSAWRKTMGERDGKKPYQNLWIISRGPTSHGCTRLASGHMSELRQIVPSESKVLERVAAFRSLPQCYEVFDIQGSGSPAAMGVQYYLAYKNRDHTPIRSYVTNRREPFYHWLYGDNITMGDVGQASLKQVPVCRFTLRKAEETGTLTNVPLYEAKFAPEPIQFYRIKPVPFDSTPGYELNRELRKVGAGHVTDRRKLLLP
ncbi:MAG TPA: hypothetical protein VMW56_09230 [Candidatus Margulisiibacteriota bacterium]|nr:hypothetical protein [Candidatus Margulisiibacteriota bacterium]